MSNSAAGPKAGSSQPYETTSLKRKREHMMYCFGDDANPLPETVALVEDIVVEYVTDLAHKAQDMGSKRGKLTVEDFLYQIRKDFPKLNRCRELLSMQEEVKQAKKAFEMDVEKLASIE
ncbi:hypothetical protein EZV62_007513 [Acer yangbiense]|uniref:Transcription initiation factor TFIID subunit 13 n=1 Tax=Acer yangbiense TaxID=1000413 RepID=A0A5C7IAS1_9ROSI|nr:hypothetical protein EZV62_007513 [Acer yangbiense]